MAFCYSLQNLSAFLTGIIRDQKLLMQNNLSDERLAVYYLDLLNEVLTSTEMSVRT